MGAFKWADKALQREQRRETLVPMKAEGTEVRKQIMLLLEAKRE